MFLLKLLRNIGKMVRGGVAPRQIALGALLGVLIGMIPGFNLSLVLAIVLLLTLSAHIGVALLGVLLGKTACLLLAPVTFRIGHTIIHGFGLEGLFRFLSETPVIALLDLHVYCLLGGLPVAALLGGLFAVLMVKLVDKLRKGVVQVTERSPRMQKLAANPFVRFFLWIVFGRRKKEMAETAETGQPLFRKGGIVLVIVLAVVLAVLEFVVTDTLFKAGARHGMGIANGAEVNLEDANIALNKGKFHLQGIQMTDPAEPARNRIEAAELSADFGMIDLLRKRYVMDRMAVRNVRFGASRETPGEVYRKPEEPEPEEPGEGVLLTDYLKKAETVRDYLLRAKDLLEKWRARKEAQAEEKAKPHLLELAANRGYLALSAKELIADRPTLLLRQLVVDGLPVPGLSGQYDLRGQNLSSHPWLLTEPMTVTLTPAGGNAPTAKVEFDFSVPDAMHTVTANVPEVALGDVLRMSEKIPVDVSNATAHVTLEGKFSASRISVPFAVEIRGFKVLEGRGMLGLSPQNTRQLLSDLQTLQVVGSVEGDIASPRVRVDVGKTLAAMKGSLKELGKRQLQRLLDDKLQQGGIRESLPGGLLDRLKKGDDEEEEDEEKEEKEEGLRETLEGLL